MSTYKTPVKDILFATEHLADLAGVAALPGHEEATPDLLEAILTEAGKLGEEVLDPLNRTGDTKGVELSDGKVSTPPGWPQAYRQFIEGGWNGLAFPQEYGGQGLPHVVEIAFAEMTDTSNVAFAMYGGLTRAWSLEPDILIFRSY